jgi:hypothetical protein
VACATFDVDEPIAIVPSGELDEDQVTAIAEAAQCWNGRFGTHLVVAGSGEEVQEVSVGFSESVCIYASGRTETTIPVQVNLCDTEIYEELGLFNFVVLHELGHVLNIRTHADDPDAVMAQNQEAFPHGFTDDDERLLLDANPGFEPVECPGYGVASSSGYPYSRCECAE